MAPRLGLFIAVLLWGSSFIALKIAFSAYDPMVVIFGRMFIASIGFLLARRWWGKIEYRSGDWKPLLLLAFFEPCLYFIFEASALVYTTASQAGMIVAVLPLMVAVAARFLLQEKLSKNTLAGCALATAGAFLLSTAARPTASAPNPALGNFLEFLAMASAVGYIILARRLTRRYPPFFLTAVQGFVGAIFFFPIIFLPPTSLPQTLDPVGVWATVYLGLFVTIGAYGLHNYGVSKIPASQASVFINLIPVVTVILGWLMLGETFTSQQWMASALVLIGVLWSQNFWRRSRKASKTSSAGS